MSRRTLVTQAQTGHEKRVCMWRVLVVRFRRAVQHLKGDVLGAKDDFLELVGACCSARSRRLDRGLRVSLQSAAWASGRRPSSPG